MSNSIGGGDATPPELDATFLVERALKRNYVAAPTGNEDDNFVIKLRELQVQLGIGVSDSVEVIYPGSNTHVGVARVFGKENVTHVDPDEESMSALEAAGFRVACMGIEDYFPDEPADVLVALNSYGEITKELAERLVKIGGIIIANDYTHWATETRELDNTRLLGAIMPNYNSEHATYVEADNLQADAPSISTETLILGPMGQILTEIPADGEYTTFSDEAPVYPDALFAFERTQ